MKSKDLQIRKMEETMHGLDLKMKEKDQKNKNLQDKVKGFSHLLNLQLQNPVRN